MARNPILDPDWSRARRAPNNEMVGMVGVFTEWLF